MKKLILSLLLILVLSACAPAQTTGLPTPTPIPMGSTDQPTTVAQPTVDNPVPETCLPDAALLDNLRTALPYQEAVITPISYGGENTLLVWFVSPELDDLNLQDTENAAVSLAGQAAKTLLETSVCLTEYDTVLFNVVDSTYLTWVSAPIPVADIPNLSFDDAGGGNSSSEGAGRQNISPPANENTCTWTEANRALRETFPTPENQAAFYYMREASNGTVYAHWRVSNLPSQEDVLAAVTALVEQVSCLSPQVSGLSATLTDLDGHMLATAYLPLDKEGGPQMDNFSYTPLQ